MSVDPTAYADFFPTSECTPFENATVDWITPSGVQVNGGKKGPGKIWFLPPEWKVYCYYEPIAWRLSRSNAKN